MQQREILEDAGVAANAISAYAAIVSAALAVALLPYPSPFSRGG